MDRAPIFFESFDRLLFLAVLKKVTTSVGWQIVAWCQMQTHSHLLLLAGREPQVSRGIQMLNGIYARELNRRYDPRASVR